jgi:hypothetical protein
MCASGFYSFKKMSEECLSAPVTHTLVTEVHHPRCLFLESTVNSDMLSFHGQACMSYMLLILVMTATSRQILMLTKLSQLHIKTVCHKIP